MNVKIRSDAEKSADHMAAETGSTGSSGAVGRPVVRLAKKGTRLGRVRWMEVWGPV